MITSFRRGTLGLLAVAGILLLSACGGSAPPSDEGNVVQQVRPAGQGVDPRAPNVDIWTASGRVVIQEFRIDLPQMKRIYALWGFYPDKWETMTQFPFADMTEFQIKSVIDNDTFERIFRGREQLGLNQQEMFRVTIITKAGDHVDYIAIIPKLVGFKDGQKWDLAMAGNPGIDRIVFNR